MTVEQILEFPRALVFHSGEYTPNGQQKVRRDHSINSVWMSSIYPSRSGVPYGIVSMYIDRPSGDTWLELETGGWCAYFTGNEAKKTLRYWGRFEPVYIERGNYA